MKENKPTTTYIDQNLEVAMAYLPRVEQAIKSFAEAATTTMNTMENRLNDVAIYVNDIATVIKNSEKQHAKLIDTRNKEIAEQIHTFETTIRTATTDIQNVNIELRKNTDSIKTLSSSLISFTNTLSDIEKKIKQNIQNTLQQERENIKKIFYLTVATNITTILVTIFLAYEVLKKP